MKTHFVISTLLLAATSVAFAQTISTRFGDLTIDKNEVLHYGGHPVQPKVEGNNSLSLVKKFHLTGKDVVLVQDNGGTACPAQYHFVTVNKWGAKATKAFGTCTDLVSAKQQGETIQVTMPGFLGYFETQAEVDRALKQRYTFVFKNGVVTERVPAASFNPFAFYVTVGQPPKGFSHFQGFRLIKGDGSNGWKKVSGGIVTDTSNMDLLPLTKIQVNPARLNFSSRSLKGESFSFSGRFLKNGDLNRFSANGDEKMVVLEGTARRFLNGKQVGTAWMRFYPQFAVS